jgi:hypothetical protein
MESLTSSKLPARICGKRRRCADSDRATSSLWGWTDIERRLISIVQGKTGKRLWIPIFENSSKCRLQFEIDARQRDRSHNVVASNRAVPTPVHQAEVNDVRFCFIRQSVVQAHRTSRRFF